MLRIALAGAGFMGMTHAARWAEQDDVQVIGVFSRSAERAHALADRVGARALTDLDALLALDADAVDICLPTDQHCRCALRALALGRHVVCEKPIALTVRDGRRMVAAARQAGRLLLVAHVVRFWPEYAHLRTLLAEGAIGRPTSAVAWRLQEGPGWVPDPDARRTHSGGPVVDLQIHDDDYLTWLFGDPRQVAAWGSERHVHAMLRFEGDVTATAEAACDLPAGYPFTSYVRVRGEQGVLEYLFRAGGVRPDQEAGRTSELLHHRPGQPATRIDVPSADPYGAQIRHFAACLRQGAPSPVIDAHDAIRALRTALRIRAALDAG